jgi:endonuclease/exonuclease/phosphatase family metal-dependent hydrolase
MPLNLLCDHAETELMMASYKFSQWRTTDRMVDPSLIDQAAEHAEWAVEALQEVLRRDRPGAS